MSGATWPMHIHEDLQAVTYVVEGALEHSDSLGNRGVLAVGGVQQRWLGWGSEHHDRNPSATERTEFIQLWLETLRPDQTALEQHNHYAREDRFERWLQIVRSNARRATGSWLRKMQKYTSSDSTRRAGGSRTSSSRGTAATST
jgi:quercetin 2,3-dioxygenase